MLTETVTETIRNYDMIKKGDKVVAALSGGADSVCLLHVLNELKTRLDIHLEAVHINHCIRGSESDGDEEFCVDLCRILDIPLKIYRIDIPALAAACGKSTEETARDARYEKFRECAGENGKIATAHTLSDSAETMLLNIARGTGLKGLCGIPPVRDNIIRPLSALTRQQIEDYLHEKNQSFRTDSTNLSDDYTRNKIRHRVIPVLLDINHGFFKSFANGQQAVREENAFLEQLTKKAYSEHFENNTLLHMTDIPEAVRKRVISKYLSDNSLPVSYDKINEVNKLCQTNGKLNISKDVFIVSKKGCISIRKAQNDFAEIQTPLQIGSNCIFENKCFFAFDGKNGEHLIDMDKVSGQIILRNRRFGDKIKLSGRNFTSSVKKLINENIPYENRPFIHFLSDDDGVIFMEGFGVADRVKTDEFSKNILSVSIKNK
ncbi:MAG: tRNA lysidine(34) synthetase TilS [Ruminococcus sp.]|nr:tRNA lysidine(34) synthetase TilS [Ruminococcus sp.]